MFIFGLTTAKQSIKDKILSKTWKQKLTENDVADVNCISSLSIQLELNASRIIEKFNNDSKK